MKSALSMALAGLVAIGAMASSAGAQEPVGNPVQRCGSSDIVTVDYTHPSLGWTKPVTRSTATRGGCASAWATGQMTAAAIARQCADVLSELFPFEPYGYPVTDMGDCIE